MQVKYNGYSIRAPLVKMSPVNVGTTEVLPKWESSFRIICLEVIEVNMSQTFVQPVVW